MYPGVWWAGACAFACTYFFRPHPLQADLWKVGQMRVGERMRFVRTTREEATAALRELHAQAAEVRPVTPEQDEFDLGLLASGVNQLGEDVKL
jgi:hypothetical protein